MEQDTKKQYTVNGYLFGDLSDVEIAEQELSKIKYLEVMVEDMQNQPLPVTRDEFETRAILYHILTELEAFLVHKKRFVNALDDKQRKLYWKENR